MLGKLSLRRTQHAQGFIVDNGPGTRRALVQCEQVFHKGGVEVPRVAGKMVQRRTKIYRSIPAMNRNSLPCREGKLPSRFEMDAAFLKSGLLAFHPGVFPP
jgi:coproporphyrinogen III oxidase